MIEREAARIAAVTVESTRIATVRDHQMAIGTTRHQENVIVRVFTEDGVVGVGEAPHMVGHSQAGETPGTVRVVLRDKIAYYGASLSPLIWQQLGLTREDFLPLEQALTVERDPLKARQLVTDKMLRIGLVGTAKELIPRLESLVAAGVRHLSFGPPLGPDPLAAIEALGREVIPYFAELT